MGQYRRGRLVWGIVYLRLEQGFAVEEERAPGTAFLAASLGFGRVAALHMEQEQEQEQEQSAAVERMLVPLVAFVAIGPLAADMAAQVAVSAAFEVLGCIAEIG